ncbi:MAG TPA: hypothetical protein VHN99_10960, partial [Deinococcales bacterium]|nr:hypothetical protein [Deinococcales bacterium]
MPDQQFVLVLSGPPSGETEAMVQGLGQAFGMDASKAEALIRRLVAGKAVSSKPMPQAGAQRAADRLRGLGLTVTLKAAEPAAAPAVPVTPPALVESAFTAPARSGSAAVLEAPAVRESAVRAPVDATRQSVVLAPDEAPADAWSSSAPSAWTAPT